MTLPSSLDAIVFDFDGVLIDSAEAYLSALSTMVAPVSRADWPKLYGMTTEEAADYASGGTIPQAKLEKLGAEIDRKVGTILAAAPPARTGAHEFVQAVRKAGLKTAVASSASRYAIDGTIEALGWSELFDRIVGREDARRAKPFPDIYAEAVRQLNVRSDRAVAIEDTHTGILAASGAGLFTIGLGGTQTKADLHAADRFFAEFTDLQSSDWFQQISNGHGDSR